MVYFEVHLDHETSAHAGASGMFQVISVTDGNGNDRTEIINVGKHYSDIDDLSADIAKALKLDPSDIDLVEV